MERIPIALPQVTVSISAMLLIHGMAVFVYPTPQPLTSLPVLFPVFPLRILQLSEISGMLQLEQASPISSRKPIHITLLQMLRQTYRISVLPRQGHLLQGELHKLRLHTLLYQSELPICVSALIKTRREALAPLPNQMRIIIVADGQRLR